jgi:GAF domain-containing protein
MRDNAEQEFISPTDEEDLEATLNSLEIPIEEDLDREEILDDVPQELTESYGTGVKDIPGYVEGGRTMRQREHELNAADPTLTGGDIDANYEQAYAVGDEAVGGTVATPDQDIVDELGAAVGMELRDREYVHAEEIMNRRDDHRWELDPKSSDDYSDRRDEEI